MIRYYCFKFVAFCMCVYVPLVACAASITLQWDPVTTDVDGAPISNLAGYHLFQSTSSLLGMTTQQAMVDPSISKMAILSLEISTVTSVSYSVTDLKEETTYFFRLTAYNTSDNQSGFNVDDNGTDEEVVVFISLLNVPDTTSPTGSISINNGAVKTSTTSVTLTLIATDSESGMGQGAQMQFSNDSVTWSMPEPYTTTKSWILTSGSGTKTVYVKFKDVSGNWSNAVSDTIKFNISSPSRPRRLHLSL